MLNFFLRALRGWLGIVVGGMVGAVAGYPLAKLLAYLMRLHPWIQDFVVSPLVAYPIAIITGAGAASVWATETTVEEDLRRLAAQKKAADSAKKP